MTASGKPLTSLTVDSNTDWIRVRASDYALDTELMIGCARDLKVCKLKLKSAHVAMRQLETKKKEAQDETWFSQVPSWAWVSIGVVFLGGVVAGFVVGLEIRD